MGDTFHWVRVMMFCYSTENTELLEEVMGSLVKEYDVEYTEGHHGNPICILSAEISKERDARSIFSVLGKDVIDHLLEELDERVDDDCVFYMRLDRQKAVQGEWRMTHHGDVISITGKVVSHPARKELAVERLRSFLGSF